ncbi:hypothetical protein Dcar01_03520 [Deinococcus carri]|uniref:Uncharacterized protein n=1 Tax=Deinococcus carri TaxID=1211323 RepID=A0ABP9WBR0_9DEIO
MDNVDVTQLIGLVTKGGPAAIIIAVFYGLAMLVREVRGGKVGDAQKADLTAQVAQMRTQLDALQAKFDTLAAELEETLHTVHTMRYQRDQARIRVEFLEQLHDCQPRTVWPPDPDLKGEP